MPSLVALVVVLVATAASAVNAESHEWYTGLRSPSGAPCCNERDCRPVAYRINRDTGREEIQANGAWYPVEYGKVLPFSSPDGGYHACCSLVARFREITAQRPCVRSRDQRTASSAALISAWVRVAGVLNED
jgi:hypothetical protein